MAVYFNTNAASARARDVNGELICMTTKKSTAVAFHQPLYEQGPSVMQRELGALL